MTSFQNDQQARDNELIKAGANASVSAGGDKVISAYSNRGMPPQKTKVTYADVRVQHLISDEELSLLCDTAGSPKSEHFYFSAGILIGSLVPALERIPRIGSQTTPMGWVDVLIVVICLTSLIFSVILGVQWLRDLKPANDLADKIRKRKSHTDR